MDAIINIDDINIKEWEKGTIEFTVTDEAGNPVGGRIAVKLDNITYFNKIVEDGMFNEAFDFSSFHDPEYDLEVIYGGNDEYAPATKTVKVLVEKADPILISIKDLQNACYRLIKWIETNKRVPGKILINKQEVTIGNLFKLLARTVSQLNENNSDDVELTWAKTPELSSENISESQLLSQECYLEITENVLKEMEETQSCPSSVEIESGKIGFMNLVYIYSTIISNSSINNGLLSGVYIKPWKEIVA